MAKSIAPQTDDAVLAHCARLLHADRTNTSKSTPSDDLVQQRVDEFLAASRDFQLKLPRIWDSARHLFREEMLVSTEKLADAGVSSADIQRAVRERRILFAASGVLLNSLHGTEEASIPPRLALRERMLWPNEVVFSAQCGDEPLVMLVGQLLEYFKKERIRPSFLLLKSSLQLVFGLEEESISLDSLKDAFRGSERVTFSSINGEPYIWLTDECWLCVPDAAVETLDTEREFGLSQPAHNAFISSLISFSVLAPPQVVALARIAFQDCTAVGGYWWYLWEDAVCRRAATSQRWRPRKKSVSKAMFGSSPPALSMEKTPAVARSETWKQETWHVVEVMAEQSANPILLVDVGTEHGAIMFTNNAFEEYFGSTFPNVASMVVESAAQAKEVWNRMLTRLMLLEMHAVVTKQYCGKFEFYCRGKEVIMEVHADRMQKEQQQRLWIMEFIPL